MTFRPPLSQKWFYPFILCACATVVYVALHTGMDQPIKAIFEASIVTLGGIWFCVILSWRVWTARVEVDDQGVRWKEGRDQGSLRWEEISKLSQEGRTLALVERASARPRLLPFVTRSLYRALTQRLQPLGHEEERILFP